MRQSSCRLRKIFTTGSIIGVDYENHSITTPQDQGSFKRLLGDGSKYGVSFTFAVQENPEGLAQAFLIGEKFIGVEPSALILGDNIFYGSTLGTQLKQLREPRGAMIFAHRVKDPERYGVIEFNATGKVTSIEEKPLKPKSPYAVPGLYFYDNDVVEIAKSIMPSSRGELEITDINNAYQARGDLKVELLGRGFAWLDTGTFASLMQAGQFVQVIEERQNLKIGCIEEVAYRMGYINKAQLHAIAQPLAKSGYGEYLLKL